MGHIGDHYLYTAHKIIDGVPKFKHQDPVLEKCPVCIQSEQPATPGCGTTLKATAPMRGFSIDYAFSGQLSKDLAQRIDYLGIHGETCWILIRDHFSGYLFGECFKTKASAINYLRDFLSAFCHGTGAGLN